jgi:hypothetical protein
MRIVGEWLLCNDGITRPTVAVEVSGAGGVLIREYFLVDSCADSTVLSASLAASLNLPPQPAPAGLSLQGISGTSKFVVIVPVSVCRGTMADP